MSSIRTAEPLPPPVSSRPPGTILEAALSASLSAAQTQSTSSWLATVDRPETTPPPPRLADSRPSSVREKDTGPRLDATRMRRRLVASLTIVRLTPPGACPAHRPSRRGSIGSYLPGSPPRRFRRELAACRQPQGGQS